MGETPDVLIEKRQDSAGVALCKR